MSVLVGISVTFFLVAGVLGLAAVRAYRDSGPYDPPWPIPAVLASVAAGLAVWSSVAAFEQHTNPCPAQHVQSGDPA